jgi:hypothetical protein
VLQALLVWPALQALLARKELRESLAQLAFKAVLA